MAGDEGVSLQALGYMPLRPAREAFVPSEAGAPFASKLRPAREDAGLMTSPG